MSRDFEDFVDELVIYDTNIPHANYVVDKINNAQERTFTNNVRAELYRIEKAIDVHFLTHHRRSPLVFKLNEYTVDNRRALKELREILNKKGWDTRFEIDGGQLSSRLYIEPNNFSAKGSVPPPTTEYIIDKKPKRNPREVYLCITAVGIGIATGLMIAALI